MVIYTPVNLYCEGARPGGVQTHQPSEGERSVKSVLLEALEAEGQPLTGATWEEVTTSAGGSNVVAYFEATEEALGLFGAADGDASLSQGYLRPLDEETFAALTRANEAKMLVTLQLFAVSRWSLTQWIEQLGKEVERARKLAGKVY